MTGELLEPGISAQHQGLNVQIPAAGRGYSKGLKIEQRVLAWRIGRPIYEDHVTIKVDLPARVNDLLEQFKVLKRIPKTEMITFALEELLQQP